MVEPRVGSICHSVGLCHAINGGSDRVGFWSDVVFIKSSISEGMGKGPKYFNFLEGGETVEVGIWDDFDWFEVLLETRPCESLLGMGCWFHSCLCGWLWSTEVSQEVIPFCRGHILKPCGTCGGTWEFIRCVSSTSVKWKSQEQASATSFISPGNHWLYKQPSQSRIIEAIFFPVVSWM